MDPIKPTDGPWELYRPPNGQLWIATGRKPNGVRNCLATIWTPEGDDGFKIVREANGRLMVASKELLEACREALHQLTPVQPKMDGLDRTRMYLREAIKKATWEPWEPRES